MNKRGLKDFSWSLGVLFAMLVAIAFVGRLSIRWLPGGASNVIRRGYQYADLGNVR